MRYVVQPGDSLSSIASRQFGDAHRWSEIARRNLLKHSDYIWIGQRLILPERHTFVRYSKLYEDHLVPPPMWGGREKKSALAPVQTHIFIFADEVNPFTRKVVRKVGVPKKPVTPEELRRIINPDRYGFDPIDPATNVSVGRHVGQNMTNSRYLSASDRMLGTPRFPELTDRYWIDADKAKAAGVEFHENSAIQADLDRVIVKATKAKDMGLVEELKRIKKLSAEVDREVLLEGHVPATAIKGMPAMGLTRGFQVVQGVGLALSVYDLGKASQRSIQEHSIVPIASETGRQAGGWAGAWAGAEIGGAAGGLLGIETGPGAIVTGAIGSLIFGTAGFFGASWAVKRMGGR